MFQRLTIALCLVMASVSAQSMDQSAMLRWGSAKKIHYHIVGDYQGKTSIAPGDGTAFADVTDRVVLDFDWSLGEGELIGAVQFENSASQVTNPRNAEPSCTAPVLKGHYEHFDLIAAKQGLGGTLELDVATDYPIVEIAQFCTGARKTTNAKRSTNVQELVVVSPMLLAMGMPASQDMIASADGKSVIVKKQGWTWTYSFSIPAE